MTKLLSAASVLALAAGASAAPFNMVSYQASGGLVPGVNGGTPFQVDFGGFFGAEGTDNVRAPTAATMTAANYYEFDSYFGMDSFGPAAKGRGNANMDTSFTTRDFYGDYPSGALVPPNFQDYNTASGGLTVAPGTFIGDPTFAAPANDPLAAGGIATAIYNNGTQAYTTSGFAPNPGGGRSMLDGVFVGRFTIAQGATLSGSILVVLNQGANQGTVAVGGTVNLDQMYALTAFHVADLDIPVIGYNSGNQNQDFTFGQASVYDVWFHVVPTPGALALFGLGGLAAIRRRRS